MKLSTKVAIGTAAAALQVNAATPSFADFDQRAKKGEDLTVAFFGGSLTWGARASDPNKTSYRGVIGQKLQKKYPKARFKFVDAAIGGTGSLLGVFRLQRDVLGYKPDLIFLDFTLNDGTYKVSAPTLASYESLVRRMVKEGKCPVVQMFLAARDMVKQGNTDGMKRYHAHMKIADAYNTAKGDAITYMQKQLKAGKLDLDVAWPPEFFDTCHPNDPGYAMYAEAGWEAYLNAVKEDKICTLPKKMLYGNSYMNWKRIPLSKLKLPAGWENKLNSRDYCAFDFLMSRWMDGVTVAANYIPVNRKKTKPAEVAVQPLKLKFHGSSVLLFGESAGRSCDYTVTIDGKPKKFKSRQLGTNTGRMWQSVAEELDPDKEHTLEIMPIFPKNGKPAELRIESICIAGPGKVSVKQ
mgnify:CR=1 FL=1